MAGVVRRYVRPVSGFLSSSVGCSAIVKYQFGGELEKAGRM